MAPVFALILKIRRPSTFGCFGFRDENFEILVIHAFRMTAYDMNHQFFEFSLVMGCFPKSTNRVACGAVAGGLNCSLVNPK